MTRQTTNFSSSFELGARRSITRKNEKLEFVLSIARSKKHLSLKFNHLLDFPTIKKDSRQPLHFHFIIELDRGHLISDFHSVRKNAKTIRNDLRKPSHVASFASLCLTRGYQFIAWLAARHRVNAFSGHCALPDTRIRLVTKSSDQEVSVVLRPR